MDRQIKYLIGQIQNAKAYYDHYGAVIDCTNAMSDINDELAISALVDYLERNASGITRPFDSVEIYDFDEYTVAIAYKPVDCVQ